MGGPQLRLGGLERTEEAKLTFCGEELNGKELNGKELMSFTCALSAARNCPRLHAIARLNSPFIRQS
jgi:hypothetical protein